MDNIALKSDTREIPIILCPNFSIAFLLVPQCIYYIVCKVITGLSKVQQSSLLSLICSSHVFGMYYLVPSLACGLDHARLGIHRHMIAVIA